MSQLNPDALPALIRVLEIIEQLDVSYHVGGSVAVASYGIIRSSADVDLVADLHPEHVDALVDQLESEYYVVRERVVEAVRERGTFNVIHFDTTMKVDIFVAGRTAFAEQEQSRARSRTLADGVKSLTFFVKSPEDLILRKLLWYRQGGEVSERQWSDVIGLIRILGEDLDSGYLSDWAGNLQIDDLLQRAMSDAQAC